jgi:putative ABC transport system permease protein
LAAAVASTKLIGALLFGVKATDAQSMAFAVLTLSCVALAAAFVPMRRAMRVDPMVALREE